MNMTSETQGDQAFVVYQLASNEKIDRFSLGMIQNNKIHGLIQQSYSVSNSEQYLKYMISSLIPLKEFASKAIKKQTFIAILRSMTKTMKEIDAYLLLQENVVFNMDFVFIEPATNEASFAYLPISSEYHPPSQYRSFIRELIQEMQFDPEENIDYVAKLINFINADKLFSLTDFDRFLQDLIAKPIVEETKGANEIISAEEKIPTRSERHTAPVEAKRITAKEVFAVPLESELEKPKKSIPLFQTLFAKKINTNAKESVSDKSGLKMSIPFAQNRKPPVQSFKMPTLNKMGNSRQTSYVAEEQSPYSGTHAVAQPPHLEQTTILGESQIVDFSAYLLRIKTGQRIYLTRNPFRIGKDAKQADFTIRENAAVSKLHAEISQKDIGYTIRDCQTTNGTFVNGTRLASNISYPLKHEDKLLFANESFQFFVEA